MPGPNDPRIFFAAERTLLAWNRTALSLMAFGFVIERFGLFLEIAAKEETKMFERHISFSIGLVFIVLAAFLAGYSAVQHRRFVKVLAPGEIPDGYNMKFGAIANWAVALLGSVLAVYLFRGVQ